MDEQSGADNGAETISDIHNYLASFNKEIQDGGQATKERGAEESAGGDEENNTTTTTTYYVAQAAPGAEGFQYATAAAAGQGQFEGGAFYTSADGNTFFAPAGTTGDQASQVQYAAAFHAAAAGDQSAQGLPDPGGPPADCPGSQRSQPHHRWAGGGRGGPGDICDNPRLHWVILGPSGTNYQTVTIVPSDTNPGEVSYVLIVSQTDEVKDEKDVDMSVYDFNEAEKHGVVREDVTPDGAKMRTIKITQKKNTAINQAHMCNYCNYTSPKRYLLTRHLKSHSEERPHKCSVCERGFKTLASLQNHMNTHTGTRPHQCKDCSSCFTTSGELVRHVRYRHTHEKPHRCTECDYASVELSKLKRHMRCHTGERPYQCPHCTYASPDTYKLKRHLRIHTGEKPYECDICHSRFTQSNSLKAHKLIHSGNKPIFQCEYCPTTCGRKTDLRIHVQKLHTSDRPLKCKRCGKSFPDRYSYKGNLIRHMSLHDPDATADERADAMKIGMPKQPGEQPDGEEDDEEDEEDYNGMDDYMDDDNAMTISDQPNHVVVFELVDYGDHQQLGEVVAAANGGPPEGVAILQQLEGSNLEEVAAAVAQVHGEDNRIIVPIGPLEMEDEGDDEASFHQGDRFLRKRRSIDYEAMAAGMPPKKVRRRLPSTASSDADEDLEDEENDLDDMRGMDSEDDDSSMDHREEELKRKQIEAKEKDMAECFGFN
ncbi:CTCF, partial [Cordylochernes scorpioides]